ncbi:MAG: SDR family NAD(P)-dependent oxidoreductase [Planctomycetota bacterium]
MNRIAIVGLGCRYPDADSPQALWEMVLTRRRAFRRIPGQRLAVEDYAPQTDDRTAEDPDSTYVSHAAVIEGFEFDRVRYRVVGSTFRVTDLAHWLALDTASAALEDAGFGAGAGLPTESTGVLVGNTLTGEFTRAGTLRLRWPYVRRVVDAGLRAEGWSEEERVRFLEQLEDEYKEPFPEPGEESLAGGLSNTIAGRICNHFDLSGGGYTVDGACSSSLLAIANSCSALVARDVDVMLAGGVDLSLDPFEMVGFARTGAMTRGQMRVYDQRSSGFIPGEGCGFVVLMREEDAKERGLRIYATVAGWGISSDGSGGMTRPEMDGHLLAIDRAYRRAGFDIASVPYFEGHGTGTRVGDATELRTLTTARRRACPDAEAPKAAIGTIKANFGHTKAAAGIAGFLKATLALQHQIIPPTTGCDDPHDALQEADCGLRIVEQGERWPANAPLRAGISSMGFGGINVHLCLEAEDAVRAHRLDLQAEQLLSSAQDCELLLLGDNDVAGLRDQIERLLPFVAQLSRAELGDLSRTLADGLRARRVRAALVSTTPDEAVEQLQWLRDSLAAGTTSVIDVDRGVFASDRTDAARIGYLFPGQGSPAYLGGGSMTRRFVDARELYTLSSLPRTGDGVATAVAQPAIVSASLAALRVLKRAGLQADAACGHSLGELSALAWGGAFSEDEILRLATVRGLAMTDAGKQGGDVEAAGAMAALVASADDVAPWIAGTDVVIAGYNGPRNTVISGPSAAVDAVVEAAAKQQVAGRRLRVSHAFHSPLVAAACDPLAQQLQREAPVALQRRVVSTISGTELRADDDVAALLVRQVTAPVRFQAAFDELAASVDLIIEVGPGATLSAMASAMVNGPIVATDAGGRSLRGLFGAVGAAFALGAASCPDELWRGRFTRPLPLSKEFQFFESPCEAAPRDGVAPRRRKVEATATVEVATGDEDTLAVVKRLLAERIELPIAAIDDDSSFLDDLHLNSIAVGQLVGATCQALNLPPPAAPMEFANSTARQLARALDDIAAQVGSAGPASREEQFPAGVDQWVRPFRMTEVAQPRPVTPAQPSVDHAKSVWRSHADDGHPFAERLVTELQRQVGGQGVLLVAAPERQFTESTAQLDAWVHIFGAAARRDGPDTFVLVEEGTEYSLTPLVKTLQLERPEITTCVVHVPPAGSLDADAAIAAIVAEVQCVRDYHEVRFDDGGGRWVPQLELLDDDLAEQGNHGPALIFGDVLLVTGGGKGIAAECALQLAKDAPIRVALLGRSDPQEDAELRENLARFVDHGIDVRYLRADVTDPQQLRAALAPLLAEWGAVTAFLHGAGANQPQLLQTLDAATVRETLAPKVDGFGHVLDQLDCEALHTVITFGSVIACCGMRGEGDYALANSWLTDATLRHHARYPHCRALAVEWSVWSGTGMGERLGRIEGLRAAGITPITVDRGVALLGELLRRPVRAEAVVVSGRMGEIPTLSFATTAAAELPLLRFLEQPRVHYPAIELVVDCTLSKEKDPYLLDHVFRGESVFPAVLGLEAMAQVATVVHGHAQLPVFEDVHFDRPVVVDGETKVRIAALRRDAQTVAVVLRKDDADCFRCVCRFPNEPADLGHVSSREAGQRVPLTPEQDLYGGILFHQGRFRFLQGYDELRARSCAAQLGSIQPRNGNGSKWFQAYLPSQLLLGDPARRDATLHAIQACVPEATLLPTAVEQLHVRSGTAPHDLRMRAVERSRDGDRFIYDVDVFAADGEVWERWVGLELRKVAGTLHRGPWVEPLLGPYMERFVSDLGGSRSLHVAVQANGGGDPLQRAVGSSTPVRKRPDGKPTAVEWQVSAAHAGALTLAVADTNAIGCDIESVVARSDSAWTDLLGSDHRELPRTIVSATSEDQDQAATRVWCALECLKKAGRAVGTPIALGEVNEEGWVVLHAGAYQVATVAVQVRSEENPLVAAILVPGKRPDRVPRTPSRTQRVTGGRRRSRRR